MWISVYGIAGFSCELMKLENTTRPKISQRNPNRLRIGLLRLVETLGEVF